MARDIIEQEHDIVILHPELSDEEMDKIIEESLEKDKEMTEWPEY